MVWDWSKIYADGMVSAEATTSKISATDGRFTHHIGNDNVMRLTKKYTWQESIEEYKKSDPK
jgi:hypothetical protein